GATFTVLLPIEADAYAAYLEATRVDGPRRTPTPPPLPPPPPSPPVLPPPVRLPPPPRPSRRTPPPGALDGFPSSATKDSSRPAREKSKLQPP
ncbi:MAG TPA: hypothetical protein VIK30_04480, partial [Polyangia bacterium]